MAGTTAPTIKTKLVALLAERPALADVQVTYGFPGRSVERDSIWLGRVDAVNEIAGMRAGTKSRNEEYSIEVVCAAMRLGENAEEAELRVTALAKQVEEEVADDPRLGLGDVVYSTRVRDWNLDGGLIDEGYLAILTIRLECNARLL